MGLEDQEYVKRRAEALRQQQEAQRAQALRDVAAQAAVSGAAEVPVQVQPVQAAASPSVDNGAAGAAPAAPVPPSVQENQAARGVAASPKPIRARITESSGGSPRKYPAQKKSKASGCAQIRDFPKKLLNAMAAGVYSGKAINMTQRDAVAAFVYAYFEDSTPDLLDGMESEEAKERVLELSRGVRKEDRQLTLMESVRMITKKLDAQAKQIETLEMLLCYLVLDRTGSIPSGLNAGKPAKKVDVGLDEVLEFSLQADEQGKSFKENRAHHYGRVKR